MNYFALICLVFFLSCSAPEKTVNSSTSETPISPEDLLPPPGGEGEIVLNEKREEIQNSKRELAFFQKMSDIPMELFRVYVASDTYKVRQIRGADRIQRKVDDGGDELTKDELKKMDLLNFIDDGYVLIGLNPNSGKLETISFDRRVPRINDVAKIIQNDASRWSYDHITKDGKLQITKFMINYQIRLYPNKTPEEIKQMLKKKK